MGPLPVIGRAAELAAVDDVLVRARRGDGAVLSVTGPAGIGKTALADEAARRAADSGFAVHWGAAWDGPGAPALWPWIQILRSVSGAGLPPAGNRFELFDAIVQMLHTDAARRPVLIVLDDLHVADDASLAVLELLARQRRGHPLAAIVTYRPAEAGPAVNRAMREAETIGLAGLAPPEVAALAGAAGAELDDRAARHLYDVTAGNPFFVLQLARAFPADATNPDVPLPATVLDVLRRQLARASTGCRRVLDAAALQGVRFDAGIVSRVVGSDRAQVDESLAEAARLELVVDSGTAPRFVHSLVVAALAHELDLDVRQQLHLATADALDCDDDHAAELVVAHLAAAGARADDRRVVATARRAAVSASARFATEDVCRYLEHAAAAARRIGDAATIVDVLVELCTAQKLGRRLESARATAREAAALARATGDGARLAVVAVAMPPDAESIEVDQLADPEQIALREEALARLPREDDGLAARLMASLAMSLYWAQRTGDRARDHRATAARRDQLTATAMQLARRIDDPATLAFCIGARLYALCGPDAPADQHELVAELLELSDDVGDGSLRQQALGWCIVGALARGEHARAAAAVVDHSRLADLRHDLVQQWTSMRWRAALAINEGRWDEGEAIATAAVELGTNSVGPVAAMAFYSVPLGLVRFLQGRLGELFEAVAEMAADPANVPAWRCGLVLAAAEAQQRDVAERELDALAVDDFDALPRDLDWLSALVSVVPAVRRLGLQARAEQLRRLLAPYADQHAIVGLGYASYGPVRRALGLLEWTLDNLDTAARELQTALNALEPGDVTYAELCRAELAEIDAQRAVRGPARRVTLHDCGDHWLLVGLDGVTHRLGRLRGLTLLRILVGRTEPISALDLLWTAEPPAGEPELQAAVRRATGGPVVDDAARAAYAAEITRLERELEAADRAGDAARSQRAAGALEQIREELRRSVARGGRTRREVDANERARVSVTKTLRRAIAAVAAADAELGAHLEKSIVTGGWCAYEPGPDDGIDWRFAWRIDSDGADPESG